MINLLSLKQYSIRPGYENNLRGSASSRRLFTHLSSSGLACRLVLTLVVLLAGVNAVWGINWTDGSSAVDKGTFYVGEPTSPTYDFNVFDYVSLSEMLSAVNSAAGTTYTETEFWEHFYARWDVIRGDGTEVPGWNAYYDDGTGQNGWRTLKSVGNDNFYSEDNKHFYTYYRRVGGWPTSFDTSILKMRCILSETASASLEYLKKAKFILYISTTDRVGATPGDQYGNNASFTSEGTLLLKYTTV